jgi:hypothetical protein
MGTITCKERNIVEAYSVLFENLSDACKIALAEHLSKTITKKQRLNDSFALSFGKWEGPDQSTDDIKVETKSAIIAVS